MRSLIALPSRNTNAFRAKAKLQQAKNALMHQSLKSTYGPRINNAVRNISVFLIPVHPCHACIYSNSKNRSLKASSPSLPFQTRFSSFGW
jgi:hypothetical protein